MVQLIFLGAPGSGKGTQALRLIKNFGYKHISTGDLLRAEIAKDTDLGKKVENILKEGRLVDDQTVLDLLKSNCDVQNNEYIFDGYPRNIEQAVSLNDLVLKNTESTAIYFEINVEDVVARIINRRVAKKSGEIYNLITKPPRVSGKCDVSGEDLLHRDDDKEAVVRNRMEIFLNAIDPMLEYYTKKGVLHRLDATRSSDLVFKDIVNVIKKI